jgi:hypothetical protein
MFLLTLFCLILLFSCLFFVLDVNWTKKDKKNSTKRFQTFWFKR